MLHNYIVVDDDSTNNLICEMLFHKYDAEANVTVFQQPEEALEYIRFSKTSLTETLLFLDVNMPTMSGWEFLDEFFTYDPELIKNIRIYILSSAIHDFAEERSIYPLVLDFKSKPLRLNDLSEINPL